MHSQSVYSRYASAYDIGLILNGYRRGMHKFFARPNLSITPQPKILDVGCGSGLMSETILRRYPMASIKAFDINKEMIGRFKGKVSCWPREKQQRVSIFVSDVFTLETKEKFDLIITGGVLEHLPVREAIAKLKTFLKPNGILLNVAVKKNWFTEKILGTQFGFKPYSLEENENSFLNAGFKEVTVFPFLWSEFPVNFLKIAIMGSL